MYEETKPPRTRKLGIALFCCAVLLTLFGAFHLIENWSGKNKWEMYKRQLIARGEKLELAQLIPPPIPPEENFAASPFFAEVFPRPSTNWNRWPKLLSTLRVYAKTSTRNERRMTDLVAFEKALRAHNQQDTNSVTGDRVQAAKELLAAIKIYEPPIQELRAASSRPRSRYNIKYDLENPWGILLPHLAVLKQITVDLSLKASAELAVGDGAAALDDVRLMARVAHSLDRELFMITYLVQIACFQIMLEPVWEGLALDRWSEAELKKLQETVMEFNFVQELATPLEVERAAGILTADILLKQKRRAELINALAFSDDGKPVTASFGNVLATLVPRGWYHLEQYNFTRLFQQYLMPGFDGTNRIIFPAISDRNEGELEKTFAQAKHPIFSHLFLARLLMPAVGKAHHKAAQAQTAAHQVVIACAIERYRRKHGDYPKALAALAPEFLSAVPHDVINGQPMHYKSGKRPVIYSVGWDDKDDQGTPGKHLWDDKGDWVWTYPE